MEDIVGLPPTPTATPTPATLDAPVGGIAELPDVASGSGSPGPPYTLLAGGLAAVALALTAGAWYTKRRWAR